MLHFSYSEGIEAGALNTWLAMRDFSAIGRAGLADRVEVVGEGVGSCRYLHMAGGSVLAERLEERDEAARTLIYSMIERGPMPLEQYQAHLQITGDDHACVVIFTAKYELRGVTEEKASRMLSNVYRALINTARSDLGLS